MLLHISKLILLGLTVILISFTSTSQCNVQSSVCESGTLSQNFNFTNSGSAYAGGAFANAGCSTGAGGNHSYGFITLYITESGPLNLLVNGSATTGFIDVAIFQIPPGTAPCTAILDGANAIGCNYASSSSGCVQFGNQFGCPSTVGAPMVNAGEEILIVVQNFSAGTSTFFNLELSETGAQTGLPNASIDPSSTGPFCTTDISSQILATNMGGVWSGPGISSAGVFNAETAGVGTHTINYSIGVAPCNTSSSAQITVGSIAISDVDVSPCQPGGVYEVSGNVNIQTPPASGDLIVEDCNGQTVVVQSAPFTAGSIPFTIDGLTAAGAQCSLYAYFTESGCSHVVNYTQPSCPLTCTITGLTSTPSSCNASNVFSVNGTVQFLNAPSTGQLIVSDCNGNEATFNAPFTSPLNYSFTNLTPDGQSCTVTAYFTENPSCSLTSNYLSPVIPNLTVSNDVSICTGNSTTLTASGATSYSWSNGVTTGTNTVSPTTTTTYTVTGTSNGCTATDQVEVSVNSNLVPTISPNVSVCLGESATITAGGGTSYQWNNGLGSSDSHTVTPAATTTYNVTVTDVNGCSGSTSTTVTVLSNPVISVPSVGLCIDEDVTLNATGAVDYTWSPGLNLSATTGSSVVFTPGQTTTYTITGEDANGCVGQTTTLVTVHLLPNAQAGSDISGCEGEQFILTGSGGGSQATYTWDNGVINQQTFVPPVGTTTYTLTVTSNFGCTDTDELVVDIDPMPIVAFTATQDQMCEPVIAVFESQSQYGVSYLWTFDNGQTVSGEGPITQQFDNPGLYGASLQVTSSNGCVSSQYIEDLVEVENKPIAAFLPTPAVFTFSNPVVEFENLTVGATTYLWDFDDNGITSTMVEPSHTFPAEEGSYQVHLTAYSPGGCVDTFSYIVVSEEDLIFYIPNTFTPDGDEKNQVFSPVFTSGYDPFSFTMIIYNRWGEAVYETHDVNVGWKGTYGLNGQECQQGTYTWKLEFRMKTTDERRMYTGHVNLLK